MMRQNIKYNNDNMSNLGLFVIIGVIILTSIITIVIKPKTYRSNTNINDYSNTSSDKLNTEYLKISNVTVTSNSLYTICTGTLTVSSYSPYKYHYIKVKGAFKTNAGVTVDTDWTYAIDSEWLEPGESTKFRLSVDKDSSIKNCSISIME